MVTSRDYRMTYMISERKKCSCLSIKVILHEILQSACNKQAIYIDDNLKLEFCLCTVPKPQDTYIARTYHETIQELIIRSIPRSVVL